MLVQIVNYVNTTARQLPNLIATRETAGFEDRPQQDVQQETAVVGLSYLPLHLVGKSRDVYKRQSKVRKYNKLRCFISVIPPCSFPALEGWCMLGV